MKLQPQGSYEKGSFMRVSAARHFASLLKLLKIAVHRYYKKGTQFLSCMMKSSGVPGEEMLGH